MAPYKIAIVADKFKGSLTASQVTSIVAEAFSHLPQVEIVEIPMADGGDGTLEVIEHCVGESIPIESIDPLGRDVAVKALLYSSGVICEMAQSTGICRLSPFERNPLLTSSYGFGLVIDTLACKGFKKFLLGVGGSATNDVGIGMLSALGFRFYNSAGNQIKSRDATFVAPSHRGKLLSGANLIEIAQIDDSDRPDYLKELQIEVACDVENPLFGERGATRIYGPQKGANAKMIEELERGVISFAYRCREWSGRDLSMVKGAGAAGGIGYALALFLNAKLRSGWRLLFDIANVENRIREADLIITGEGRVDRQSLYGKLLEGVLQLATKYRKRVWVVCGENRLSTQELKSAGVEQLFSISQIEPNKNMAIASAKRFLTIKAQEAAKLLEVELSSKVGL